jgi:acyl carrier protein phosphodiesterase
MNFLAHAYLSFGYKEVLVGNMISDFVKGKARFLFSSGIQRGISLHRLIDQYTDTHDATRKAKEVFRSAYRLFSAPLVDIVFDHFLATDEERFERGLKEFSSSVYATLEEYNHHLPSRFLAAFTYMKHEDWLYNYRTRAGIEKSLIGLVRRSSFYNDSTTACNLFNEHYNYLQECYSLFFGDVKYYTKEQLRLINLDAGDQ